MFRVIALIILLATAGGFIALLRRHSIKLSMLWHRISNAVKRLIGLLKKPKQIGGVDFTMNIVFPLALTCLIVLAVTGFVPPVVFGVHLTGYLLMFHLVVGAVYAFFMVILALLWSHEHRFNKTDSWAILQLKGPVTEEKRIFWQKVCFWFMEALTLPLVFSIVASMYKIFGTHGQEFLLQLHRYSALGVLVAMSGYGSLVKVMASNTPAATDA